jgi:hypothetical protein
MVDWKALIGTLALPAAIASGVWLLMQMTVSEPAIDEIGGRWALLFLMMRCAYGLAAVLLALEGLVLTIEAYGRGSRLEWSRFPTRYDLSAAATAIALSL